MTNIASSFLVRYHNVVLIFSKYANVKLGSPDDKPEYNNFTWFMMLFACGVGVGLFFYGVGEPIYHYTGRNRYSADPSLPDNELAQIAINLPMYHWGKYHLYLMLILYVFFALKTRWKWLFIHTSILL